MVIVSSRLFQNSSKHLFTIKIIWGLKFLFRVPILWHVVHFLLHFIQFIDLFKQLFSPILVTPGKQGLPLLIGPFRSIFQMKMNAQQGAPAPTSAIMPWAPITAPAQRASPQPQMGGLVKVVTKLNLIDTLKQWSCHSLAKENMGLTNALLPYSFCPYLGNRRGLHQVCRVSKRDTAHSTFIWATPWTRIPIVIQSPQHSEERQAGL